MKENCLPKTTETKSVLFNVRKMLTGRLNYKKIIKSQKTRIKILQMLNFVPDEVMVKVQYRIKTGNKLNLNSPMRYTEKLQWYKLFYYDPRMIQCVDKYEVRHYVEEKGLGSILNVNYGVYNNPCEIDFDKLPDKFVCKDTLGSGSERVILVDKNRDSYEKLMLRMREWLESPIDKKDPGREWPYDGKKHRIIIEEFLEDRQGDLADYKFFCFDGKMKCFYVRSDYAKTHENGQMAFFDDEKVLLKGVCMDYCNISAEQPILPGNIDDMICYAELLSKDFPHARVDFYNVNGKIVFGEITFFNASGYMRFLPDSFDYVLGESFILPPKEERKVNV